jgi:hypothetical protein
MNRSFKAGHGMFVLLSLLLLAACGSAPADTPLAAEPAVRATPAASPLPAHTQEATTAAVTPTQQATALAVTPTLGPTPPATSPPALSGADLVAWDVAGDGALYVLDGASSLYALAPGSLAPLAQSSPLFEPRDGADAYLVAGEEYIFVASGAISQTLVLDRSDLSPVARLDAFGPLAIEPGQRLFLIPQGLETQWPWGNFEIWAYELDDLDRPPERMRHTGASFDDLTVDADARRLYVLASNINASPPHRGQNYEVYSLEPLTRTASFTWERGSLTPPVVNPRSGEVLGSRIGLNLTRRFIIFDPEGGEVRSLLSVDGQPAIDAGGEWIYLLRQRGLWVLRQEDLDLAAFLPFAGGPPGDLALSPDGETLYLLGYGWLTALSTAELRSQGIMPISPLPAAWFAAEQTPQQVQPHLYPSPHMERDGTAFLQLVSGVNNVVETYYTQDGGRSWHLLASLVDPSLAGAAYLSLSPDYDQDRTLTAQRGLALVRSTDGGLTWEPWQPRIAFTSERGGDREIYTMDAEGNDVRRLTHDPGADETPAWSPAWTRLAFQSDRNGNWDIFDLRADCGLADQGVEGACDLRQLTDDPADDLLPAWSPDGRSIAFVSTRDGNPEIYVMDSDGGNQRRLTFHPGGDWRPAWLSDSKHLVFVSDRSGNNDIYRMAVPLPEDGPPASEPPITPVVVSAADDRDPAVMAGYVDRLLFLSDRDGIFRAYAQDVGGGGALAFPKTETGQPEAHPATLPADLNRILVSSERDGPSNIYRAILAEYVPLAPSTAFDGHPAAEATGWRPDPEASLSWLQAHEN